MSVFNELDGSQNLSIFNENGDLHQRAFFQFYLGKRIKALREARGISREQLAAILSISVESLGDWESGILSTAFTYSSLTRLTAFFEVLLTDFFPPLKLGRATGVHIVDKGFDTGKFPKLDQVA